MRLSDPCKNCIVDPICRKACDVYEDYKERRSIIDFAIQIITLITYICIIILPVSIYLSILEDSGVNTEIYDVIYILFIPAVVWGGAKMMVWLESYLAKTRSKR
jgi:hypothetical protein